MTGGILDEQPETHKVGWVCGLLGALQMFLVRACLRRYGVTALGRPRRARSPHAVTTTRIPGQVSRMVMTLTQRLTQRAD